MTAAVVMKLRSGRPGMTDATFAAWLPWRHLRGCCTPSRKQALGGLYRKLQKCMELGAHQARDGIGMAIGWQHDCCKDSNTIDTNIRCMRV